MRLRYLGKTVGSAEDSCEVLYVTGSEALAGARDLADDECIVEVPADLLRLGERA